MKSFLAKIFVYSFFSDLIFIYPVYAVMFVENGLSPLQISSLFIAWAGTSFLLEVPSGVLADTYSRKTILILAQLIRLIGYIFWITMPNFLGFLLGFILWGVQSACTSGTLESFVYDELKMHKQENQYAKVLGQIQSLGYLALLFSGVGASLSIQFGYRFVLLISLFSLLISACAIALIPKVQTTKSTQEKQYFSLLRQGLRTSLKNTAILKIIIFVALGQALFGALDEYWSIFATEAGLAKSALGIFFVFYSLSQIAASVLAYRFEKKSVRFFESLFLLNGMLLLIAAHFYTVPFLLLLFLLSFSFKIIDIVMQSALQHQLKSSEVRATVTSVQGFFVELAVVGLYLIVGIVAKNYDYQNAFLSIGWVICLIGLTYLVLGMKRKV